MLFFPHTLQLPKSLSSLSSGSMFSLQPSRTHTVVRVPVQLPTKEILCVYIYPEVFAYSFRNCDRYDRMHCGSMSGT